MIFLYVAALWTACRFFKKRVEEEPVIPMTVIKPIRGPEDGLEENLRSLLDADREGVLQVLFVMEGREDPAFPVASKVAAAYPGRDVRVVLSGPSGTRLGKMHNMMEGFKKAGHPFVVFSDADIVTDRQLLAETSRAFLDGAGAACALPDAGGAKGTDALIGVCFNHYFDWCVPFLYKLGLERPFAGGWMAFSKETIRKMGGLEPYSRRAADDYALGIAAAKAGAKIALLPRMARIRERGGTFADAVRHFFKWVKVLRFTVPVRYIFLPLVSPIFMAGALWLLAALTGKPLLPPSVLLAAIAGLRMFLPWVQDLRGAAGFFPWWCYVCQPALDAGSFLLWFCAFFTRTLAWRGKRYRLLYDGEVEVI